MENKMCALCCSKDADRAIEDQMKLKDFKGMGGWIRRKGWEMIIFNVISFKKIREEL